MDEHEHGAAGRVADLVFAAAAMGGSAAGALGGAYLGGATATAVLGSLVGGGVLAGLAAVVPGTARFARRSRVEDRPVSVGRR